VNWLFAYKEGTATFTMPLGQDFKARLPLKINNPGYRYLQGMPHRHSFRVYFPPLIILETIPFAFPRSAQMMPAK
jgi:hypothetical protein